MKLRPLALAALIITTVMISITHSAYAAWLVLFVGGAALSSFSPTAILQTPTLVAREILPEIIAAFAVRLPMLAGMSTIFRPTSLKLNKQYTGHISTVPTVRDYDGTSGYQANAAAALDHLVDVDVTCTRHRHVPLKWTHLTQIANDKNAWNQVIGNAGFALARNFVLDILAEVKARNFSQSSTFATADCDADMLNDVAGDMNSVGAMTEGRVMLVNTAVANTLAADSRLSSKDFAGQLPGGSSLRRWTNTHGFALIQEYPELPANNGTALTSATAEADDDLITKAAHGLVTGDRVVLTAITNGAGLTQGSTYYVIYVSSSTFKLATTAANAAAGTAIDITTDGTSITITPTENVVAFAFTPEAIALVAGPPEPNDAALMAALNIPATMGWTPAVTELQSGITMAGVGWQTSGLGDLYWSPVLLWGKALGRQAGDNAAGLKCDYGGHRIISA